MLVYNLRIFYKTRHINNTCLWLDHWHHLADKPSFVHSNPSIAAEPINEHGDFSVDYEHIIDWAIFLYSQKMIVNDVLD